MRFRPGGHERLGLRVRQAGRAMIALGDNTPFLDDYSPDGRIGRCASQSQPGELQRPRHKTIIMFPHVGAFFSAPVLNEPGYDTVPLDAHAVYGLIVSDPARQ